MTSTTTPEHLDLRLPHLRVHALAWGPTDGPLALCLHGYPDTAWTWRHMGPALAQRGYRVVAPFTRGYAPTEIPRDNDYHLGALMFDAIALHHELGGNADSVLIGHDWGGLAAGALAAYPHCPFGRIVSMGVPLVAGMGPQHNAAQWLALLPGQLRRSWYVFVQQIPGLAERQLHRIIPTLWRQWCPPGFDSRQHLAEVWDALPDVRHRNAAVSYYRANLRPIPPAEPYRYLQRFAGGVDPVHPMLLLYARDDGAVDHRLAAMSAQSLAPGSRAEEIADAGHFMHLDQPEAVLRILDEYLSEPRS
ncbi:alpha/beta fold hydrolase [Mycobacterium sp. smrl_JER01]|uniref:alpha/beta fold hydrolase n=1 Tax=Mycobacterium sp. smrl_JER01 TaxID=3402633 RepID=UPI003AD18D16